MVAPDSSEDSSLSGLLGALACGLGAGFAGYSVLVKLAAVPCFSASCGAVINSAYGALAGIPVGLFGLVFWGLLPWMPRWGRVGLKALMVVGSVVFILIQALVLDQFCPICLAHALTCFAAAALPIPRKATTVAVYGGLVLALVLAVRADATNRRSLRERIPVAAETDAAQTIAHGGNGLPWLAAASIEDVDLVISLSCGQCQRIIEQLLAERGAGLPAPGILLLTEDGNTNVTRLVVAAVLSEDESARAHAFARAMAVLLDDPAILARDDAATAGFLLSESFPGLESALDQADALLEDHADVLAGLGIETTPALVVAGQPAPFDWGRVRSKD